MASPRLHRRYHCSSPYSSPSPYKPHSLRPYLFMSAKPPQNPNKTPMSISFSILRISLQNNRKNFKYFASAFQNPDSQRETDEKRLEEAREAVGEYLEQLGASREDASHICFNCPNYLNMLIDGVDDLDDWNSWSAAAASPNQEITGEALEFKKKVYQMAKQKGDNGILPYLESLGLSLSSASHLARYLSSSNSNAFPLLIHKVKYVKEILFSDRDDHELIGKNARRMMAHLSISADEEVQQTLAFFEKILGSPKDTLRSFEKLTFFEVMCKVLEPGIPSILNIYKYIINPLIIVLVQRIMILGRCLSNYIILTNMLCRFHEMDIKNKNIEEVLRPKRCWQFSSLYLYVIFELRATPALFGFAESVLGFVSSFGEGGKGDELLVMFKNLPFEQNKHFRDVRVYNAAISGLLFSGRYDDAWKVYELMETSNIQPDHVTSSIMITIMRKRGDSAKESWEFFEKMHKKGVKWSLKGVGALIKSFCDEGLKKEALIVQSELEKRGISSNAIIYNTIMDAYSKSNQVEEAEGLFAEMKAKRIAPTSATYNILMDTYSRRMQPEIVEKLLQEMEANGLDPNVRSYTCLISAYGRQKKMSDMAADAFLRMKKAGIRPSSHSYTALIHAYSVDGWHEKAFIAFDNMLREGIKPSIETYTALLDAFRRAGDTETLMKIWKMMIRERIEGTRVTFNILVDGFAKQGQYVEARDVICEFGKIGFHPTVMTYNMLINAYARGGQESKLPQLLKEMAALNLKPDSVTYSTMIYAYVRVRDFKRAFFYHKQMVKSGQVPDARSYQKLRAILDVKAKIKNRKDKSALMGIIKSSMGLLKQKKKGKKDEFWKNKKKRTRMPGSAQASSR
ncbi:hypothetical protein DH2020_012884 [Rehmannia glutinosa]|uniref:Pentatricopeptide repeat-containing protein n=1 Tax=Rehmannia glutinosa TaxID=99300 RepID=A0ABR0X1D2_REHGL